MRFLFSSYIALASVATCFSQAPLDSAAVESLMRLPRAAKRGDFTSLYYQVVPRDGKQFLKIVFGDKQSTYTYINVFLEFDEDALADGRVAFNVRIVKGIRENGKFALPTDDTTIQRVAEPPPETRYS